LIIAAIMVTPMASPVTGPYLGSLPGDVLSDRKLGPTGMADGSSERQ
jgi:hypothetical protein